MAYFLYFFSVADYIWVVKSQKSFCFIDVNFMCVFPTSTN